MAQSWKSVDPNVRRPTLQEAEDAANRLRFRHRPQVGSACQELLGRLQEAHCNGGALLASFDVDDDPTSSWFASRNMFHELGFFGAFLQSAELRAVMREDDDGSGFRKPEIRQVPAGAYWVDGWLAGVLVTGGAYEGFQGTPHEARMIAGAATNEVVQERYDDFVLYRTFDAWSPWFWRMVWNTTGIAIDLANKQVTILTITDTD